MRSLNTDLPKLLARYFPYFVIVCALLIIYSPFIQLPDTNAWYNYTQAIIVFTLFAIISVWVLYATSNLKERLKYILVPLLMIMIIFIKVALVAVYSPIYSFVYLQILTEYLCPTASDFFIANLNDGRLDQVCQVLKPL